MDKRDEMTPVGRPGAGATRATPSAPDAPSAADAPPAGAATGRAGVVARSLGWYRGLGRRGRLAALTGGVAIAVGIALSVIGSVSGGATTPKTLPVAKGFTLGLLGKPGQHLSLSQYAGKPLVLNFFASWCTPCQKETPLIAKYYRDAHGSVTVIGIDVNDPASSALAFVHAKGVTYPVATDPAPMTTAISYGVDALPQTFFLNARHQIVKRIVGPVSSVHQIQADVALMRDSTK